MIEKANNPKAFLNAINGSVNGSPTLIMCDERNGWMDLSYCKHTCYSKCYKFNTGRWICSLLRCTPEKITACDEKDERCVAWAMIDEFSRRYTDLFNKIAHEV
jgi:hypothetical protein